MDPAFAGVSEGGCKGGYISTIFIIITSHTIPIQILQGG